MISFPYTSVKTYLTDGTPQYDRAISSDIKRAFNKLRYKQGIAPDSGGAFHVTAGDGMNINVNCNDAWCLVGGDFGNEILKTRTLSREAANTTYDRIDRIVLRNDLSKSARKIDLYVLTGTPSASPTAPVPTNTPTVQEIVLADVFTPKGISTTSNERITDQRLNPTLCGVLSSAFGNTDTQAFFTQITALIARLNDEITGIQQGSAVMLKSVYGGKQADSVKKADALTTTLAIASGGTGTTSLALLKSALALDRASNTPDAEKTVKSAAVCTGNAATATNATDHINNRNNPHGVTKAQIGLGNVDNTADNVKSVSYAATAGRANSAGSADSAGTATTAGNANTAGSATKSTNTTFEIGTSKIRSQGDQQTIIQSGDDSYQVCVGVSPTQGWSVYPFSTEMPSPVQRPCPGMLLGTNALPWSGVYSKTPLSQVSDKREKHDIKPLNAKYVDFVLSVNPSEFVLNSDTDNKISLGFIAQEIEQNLKAAGIEPERMNVLKIPKGKDGKYNLCYSDFIAPLVLTVQAQQQQINQLSARLDALEAKK